MVVARRHPSMSFLAYNNPVDETADDAGFNSVQSLLIYSLIEAETEVSY
jgi:hypothetical protein